MFKVLTSCLNKSARPLNKEIEKIPPFIFCRWLANDPRTIGVANIFNLYYSIPIVNQWKMVHNTFAGKIRYIEYPKNIKTDDSLIIQLIQKEYSISKTKAYDYLSLMTKENQDKLLTKYKNYKGQL